VAKKLEDIRTRYAFWSFVCTAIIFALLLFVCNGFISNVFADELFYQRNILTYLLEYMQCFSNTTIYLYFSVHVTDKSLQTNMFMLRS
jgi:Na+-driven multidrug efflux pump